MSKALATTGGERPSLLAQLEAGDNPYDDIEKEAGGGIFGDYLNLNGSTGEFVYGEDKDELDTPFDAYVDVESMIYGWKCWKDSKPVDEVSDFYLNKNSLPDEGDLTDHGPYEDDGDGWREFYSLHIVVPGKTPEEDQKFTYQINTQSSISQLGKFIKAWRKAAMQHIGDDGKLMIPLVEFDTDSFMPRIKKHGRKYFVTMKLIDGEWIEATEALEMFAFSPDEEGEGYEDEPEQEEKPAPRKSSRKAAKKPEPEKEDEGGEDDASNYEEGEDEKEEKPARGRGNRGRAASKEVEEEAPEQEEKPVSRGRGRGRGRG